MTAICRLETKMAKEKHFKYTGRPVVNRLCRKYLARVLLYSRQLAREAMRSHHPGHVMETVRRLERELQTLDWKGIKEFNY